MIDFSFFCYSSCVDMVFGNLKQRCGSLFSTRNVALMSAFVLCVSCPSLHASFWLTSTLCWIISYRSLALYWLLWNSPSFHVRAKEHLLDLYSFSLLYVEWVSSGVTMVDFYIYIAITGVIIILAVIQFFMIKKVNVGWGWWRLVLTFFFVSCI
jgi:hypothetical protein